MAEADWVENGHGLLRRDGTKILRISSKYGDPNAHWVFVIMGPGDYVQAHCPCCGKEMRTARAAQMVADAERPIQDA